MTENDKDLKQLQFEYLSKRLELTLHHTQVSTKLFYLVYGAILGFCYFLIKALGVSRLSVGIAAFPILILSMMNYFHAGLIHNQQSWFNDFDRKIRKLLSIGKIKHKDIPTCFPYPKSSHRSYRYLHMINSIFLAIAGMLMVLYGFFDKFNEILPK